ncbi:glutathione S-transferase T3-like [Eutrema salsugineum]|uniref:glutathione S-transferase T3-like n=1 Tax=Eutrema salsugineum TaxID=72664 RepID=UPI000CED2546|nr:glutathione S-transferase T3-like [Eutrema salsugineum]
MEPSRGRLAHKLLAKNKQGPCGWQRAKVRSFLEEDCGVLCRKSEACMKCEGGQCKQQWYKINDLVCKLFGAYESASREKASGMNENHVIKMAHQIFFSDQKKKFNLEHAWKELRNDQKWSELSSTKADATSEKRRAEEGSHSPSAITEELKSGEDGLQSICILLNSIDLIRIFAMSSAIRLWPKFDGKGNFGLWQSRVKDLLTQQGMKKELLEKKPDKIEKDDWDDMQDQTVSTIRLCLSDDITNQVMNITTCKEMWDKLEKMYMSKSLSSKLYLKQKLYGLKMAE